MRYKECRKLTLPSFNLFFFLLYISDLSSLKDLTVTGELMNI